MELNDFNYKGHPKPYTKLNEVYSFYPATKKRSLFVRDISFILFLADNYTDLSGHLKLADPIFCKACFIFQVIKVCSGLAAIAVMLFSKNHYILSYYLTPLSSIFINALVHLVEK